MKKILAPREKTATGRSPTTSLSHQQNGNIEKLPGAVGQRSRPLSRQSLEKSLIENWAGEGELREKALCLTERGTPDLRKSAKEASPGGGETPTNGGVGGQKSPYDWVHAIGP